MRHHHLQNRRHFLQAAGAAGLVVAAGGLRPQAAFAQDAGKVSVTKLRDDLMLIGGAGGNVVALRRPDGLALVDSGSADRSRELLDVLRSELGAAPVRILFNTHWHLDHTGGNDALIGSNTASDGIAVIAHENTRLWMSTKFFSDWENKRYLPRAKAAQPNKTFFASDPQPQTASLGDDSMQYAQLLQAHTDGDIYVAFPKHNVIAAGGVVTAARYPVLDYITGGWIGGNVDAIKKLIAMCDADTLVVPDSGPPQKRADLEAQVQMLETVRARIEEIALKGQGVDDMIAAEITKEFDARFAGDSALFISNAYEGMWWNRIRGIVA
jgi:glyoxylase-like metal-dependent hydrolase (beta-lactamase superfamily II)